MGRPRLKCLGPGSVHPTSFSLLLCATRSTSSAHRTSPSTRSTFSRVILTHAQVARFLPTSHTSTYSQYFQPYRISAHRGTPNLSSTLSPQLAVSRTAAPLPMRYRLSAISYHYDFALLALTVSTCETLLPGSYIVIKWSLETDVKESFKQLTTILQLISIILHYHELNNTYIHLLQLTSYA